MSKEDIEELPSDFISLTPANARKYLDAFALAIQEDINDDASFEKILLYMHQYLIGQAYNHYTIKGYEAKDLYQEGLIALRFKAIPKFNPTKGMSFLNFAKMCIRRHMITLLNTAMNRKKDQPINRAISLDQEFGDEDGDGSGTMLNTMVDESSYFVDEYCSEEDKQVTIENLKENLSEFEATVLDQYLKGYSYKSMAVIISKKLKKKYKEKSVDNALLRIRKKAVAIFEADHDLPIFFKENEGETDDSEDQNWEDQESPGSWM